jgi:hypothetical protein
VGSELFGPGDAWAVGDQGSQMESDEAVIVSVTAHCEVQETSK